MSGSEPLLTTPRFQVVNVAHTDSQGQRHTRAVIRHPGAVTLIPVLDSGHLCLIKNFRVSVNRTLFELPAGTMDPGETPLETAHRELIEETGYSAAAMEPLSQFFMSPGILDERMHLYVATGLVAGTPQREPGEQIENHIVSLHDALAMVADQRIEDAKTMIGLLLYERLRLGNGPLPEA